MKTTITALLGLFIMIPFLVSSPAFAQDDTDDAYYESGYAGYDDPLEGLNRGILQFNNVMDTILFDPVTETYRFIVPEQGRKIVTNALRNLRAPLDFTNQLLQGDISGGATILFRFIVNSFSGFAGLLDVAAWEGIEYEAEDFGQTLAVWGIPDGPYVVVPFFGGASLRDALGYATDSFADPLNRYAFNIEEDHIAYTYNGIRILDAKHQLFDTQKDLKRNSLDYYSALRSVVYQNRQAEIHDNRKKTSSQKSSFAYIPDYDDF